MKIVALMRTKNSIMVLHDCLRKLSELVDEIIVMDNGSTDGSIEVLREFPKVIKVLLHDDTGNFHEGRDMNALLEEARSRNPDWILMTWPDEVFEGHLTRRVVDRYMSSAYDRIDFRLCHFWLSTKYCRYDRDWFLYSLRPQRQMFRNLKGIYYNDIRIHPGTIQGIATKPHVSPYRIKHYGYAFKQEVDTKVAIYKALDPDSGKYDSSDTSIPGVLRYPFIEFKNQFINSIYITVLHVMATMLEFLVGIKRRYFRSLKIFSSAS